MAEDVAAAPSGSRTVWGWRAPDPGCCPEVGSTGQVASERGISEKSLRLRAGYVEPGAGDT